VLISLLVLLHELDHPRVVASGPAPGLVVVRPEERLFFANARRLVDHIAAVAGNRHPPPRERPLQMLRRAAELLGRTDLQADTGRLGVRVFPNLDDAIAAYHEQTLPDHPPV